MAKQHRLNSLEEAAREVRALAASASARPLGGAWTVAQVLNHCAASIEYSRAGYPQNKPALVQKTVGRFVLRRFLARGALSHNRNAPIPGDKPLEDPGTQIAAERLLKAIADFQATPEPLAPHFVYGPMTKADYERIHAMHVADHLSGLEY